LLRKNELSAEKVAEKLADLALRQLKVFSEEEQERRIAAAERRVFAKRVTTIREFPR